MKAILTSVFSDFWAKLGIAAISYFTPIKGIVNVMLIFLLVDTLSGIWASKKAGDKFSASKLYKVVSKFIWYTVAVMLCLMMEREFQLYWTNLSSIVGGVICFVELKSIFENITRITGDPIFNKIVQVIRRKGSETIQEIGDEDKKEEKP